MKKSLLLLILVCFSTRVYSQININELINLNGKWYKQGEEFPYNGDFIQTNKKGHIIGSGTFLNGLLEGLRIAYFDNGIKECERYYKNGIMNGIAKEYYINGNLKQEVMVINNKNEGTGIIYYETGEKHAELNFENGIQQGNYFEYAKDGKLTRKFWFVDGVPGYSPDFLRLLDEAVELSHRFENEAAIAKYDEAILINSTYAQAYFNRGCTKSNNFDYEGAIQDYNIAIELEPDYMEAYVNRAYAKINKYTSQGILTPSKQQIDGACEDFDIAKKLGADKKMIQDMKYCYCKKAKKKNKEK